jgi:hypothetical protein
MKHTGKKSNEIKKHMLILPMFLVAVVALILGTTAPELWASGGGEPFDEAEIFFEFNSTDLDLGIQFFVDGEAWKRVKIFSPNWRKLVDVKVKGNARVIGLTEIFSESAEPPLCPEPEDEEEENGCTPEEIQDAIDDFLALFPPGQYKFFGRTIEGDWLTARATLTHALPAAPGINSPEELEEGEDLQPEDIAVIDWDPGTSGPEIVGWEVVAEMVILLGGEETVYVNTATFPAGVTSFTVAEEFVRLAVRAQRAGILLEYKAEVIAREESGNKTITEVVVFEFEEE